jgi:hypothetical protein
MLLNPARANQLRKPLLCIVISDGAPAGEPADAGESMGGGESVLVEIGGLTSGMNAA